MLSFLDHLSFARLRIGMEVLEPVSLPAYPGAVLRGGLGAALKELDRRATAGERLYSDLFDIRMIHPPRGARGMHTPPRPYVVMPPFRYPLRPEKCDELQLFTPGDVLWFSLTLTGTACRYFDSFIEVLKYIAAQGMGPGRGHMRLIRVKDMESNFSDLYDPESEQSHDSQVNKCRESDGEQVESWRQEAEGVEQVAVVFRTPTRMVVKHRLLRQPEELDYRILISQLFDRVFFQVKFHCQAEAKRDSWPQVVEPCLAEVKVTDRELMWYDMERYSDERKILYPQGGFVGRLVLVGRLEPLFPLLRAGEVLHVGKATTVGMGHYVLERLA